jgi:hypothetical protein
MSGNSVVKILAVLLVVFGAFGMAMAQMPNPYGTAISLENAKKAAAPALAEAAKNNWRVAVAIVGPAGTLIYYEKMDNTQLGSAHRDTLQTADESVSGCAGGRRRRAADSYAEGRSGGGRRNSFGGGRKDCRRDRR